VGFDRDWPWLPSVLAILSPGVLAQFFAASERVSAGIRDLEGVAGAWPRRLVSKPMTFE
jgi:hypothetical protein